MADEKVEPKVRRCTAEYKNDIGELLTCDAVITKGQPECKNKKRHLYPFVSGFCSSGFHEGTRAKGANGVPARVCEFWQSCPCQCHKDLDQLFSMTGQERLPQENPEYRPPKNPFWMPSLEERALMHGSSIGGSGTVRTVVESPLPEAVPVTVRRTFTPTPSGRAGRGELETWVKEACDEWIVEKPGFPCTPLWIANWIVKAKAIPSQSQGAVNAVFERWIDIGFATIEKKPTRFIGYTPDGIRMGLDALKLRAKDSARRKRTMADKGIRS